MPRRCREAAAGAHSMTWRSSNDCGIVSRGERRSGVMELKRSGWITGRSAGFAPLRMRPAWCRVAMRTRDVAAVAHQTAVESEVAPLEDGRQAEAQARRDELLAPAVEERVVGDDERADPARRQSREDRSLAPCRRERRPSGSTFPRPRRRPRARSARRRRMARIDEQRAASRQDGAISMQVLEAARVERAGQHVDAGGVAAGRARLATKPVRHAGRCRPRTRSAPWRSPPWPHVPVRRRPLVTITAALAPKARRRARAAVRRGCRRQRYTIETLRPSA